MKKISVAYACSNEYFDITFSSIKSLIENNKNLAIISLYLLSDHLSNDNIAKLGTYVRKNDAQLYIININGYLDRLRRVNSVNGSYTTYGRLFLAEVCPDEKVLYIDSDTYINDSIVELFDIDMRGKMIGGVQDCINRIYYQMIGLDPIKYRYINGGVLLLNLDIWRKRNCTEKIMDYIDRHSEIPNFDQGVINDLFRDDIIVIDLVYNVMPQIFYFHDVSKIKKLCGLKAFYSNSQMSRAINKPKIVHFTGSESTPYLRPWLIGAGTKHPFADKFLDYYDGETSESKTTLNMIKHKLFKNLPFPIYLTLEKMLGIRRRIIEKKSKR